ncbi:DUF192 domain-containing protein [Aliidiomarina sp. Khilg15.8]
MGNRSKVVLLTGSLMLLMACTPSRGQVGAEPQSLASETICLQGETQQMIEAQLARTGRQRAVGLMHVESMAAHHGMLFHYPEVAQRGFWMYQTLIPLDIAYLAEDGEILQILTMQPCASGNPRNCPSYPAAQPFKAALELNAGAFAEYNIQVGDHVLDEACENEVWNDWDD